MVAAAIRGREPNPARQGGKVIVLHLHGLFLRFVAAHRGWDARLDFDDVLEALHLEKMFMPTRIEQQVDELLVTIVLCILGCHNGEVRARHRLHIVKNAARGILFYHDIVLHPQEAGCGSARAIPCQNRALPLDSLAHPVPHVADFRVQDAQGDLLRVVKTRRPKTRADLGRWWNRRMA